MRSSRGRRRKNVRRSAPVMAKLAVAGGSPMRIVLATAALALAASAAASPSSEVARLSWLTGSWSETKGEVTTRETWEARDGALVGTGETLRPGKPAHVERMKITAEPAGATFTAILPGQPPTPFLLRPGKEGEAVFENKAHD